MTHITVAAGRTVIVDQPTTFAGYASIAGSSAPGPGGSVFVTSRDVIAARGHLRIDGGGYSTQSHQGGSGGQLTVTGLLIAKGGIELVGGQAGPTSRSAGTGATLQVSGELDNAGTLLLDPGTFGRPQAGSGSLLRNTGVLVNSGLVQLQGTIGGGYSPRGYDGATLYNLGTLTNTGTLAVMSGDAGIVLNAGLLQNDNLLSLEGADYSAILRNTGTLLNDGTIELGGGGALFYVYGSTRGAALFTTGSLDNIGLIEAQGGQSSFGLGSGPGGYIAVDAGTLTNAGTILLQGGLSDLANPIGAYGGGGGGQVLVADQGRLVNTGTIIAQGGNADARGAGILVGQPYDYNVEPVLQNEGDIFLYAGTDGGSGASLTVNALGFLDLSGGTIASFGDFGSQAEMVNFGRIEGSGVIQLGSIVNNGYIGQNFSRLTIAANISGTGILDQSLKGTLELDGSIGIGQTLQISGNGAIQTGMGNAGLLVLSQTGARLVLTGGGSATLNAADTSLTVQLADPGSLTLSQQGQLTVSGSGFADSLTAQAAGQTLKGLGGADRLIGSAATGDTFLGTAADQNGDTIGNFAGTDVIDITDLAPGAGLSLRYSQGSGQGTLTLHEGTQTTSLVLLGSFSQTQFTTASDNHGGLLIGLLPST